MGLSRLSWVVIGLTGLMLSFDLIAFSQDKKAAPKKAAAIAPAEKLAEGWDAIDERLIFLMIRLANTETSLEAVENAIAKATGKKSVKTAEAKKADRENEAMDRKGGGPTRWSTFYGTTAEKFFYHPTDRNSTYHTVTVLSQQGPRADNKVGGGVPAGQGLPVHQRPPQFDYIYRANEKAKDRAESEAAQFKGKIEALLERRQRLEAEQAGLWCEIAFRAVAHYDLHKKPIYRFEPLLAKQDDPTLKQHAEVMKSAAMFMRLALSIIDAAQKDQATTFSGIKTAVSEAREKLDDTLLRQGVDASDKKTIEGRFAALAKRLDDVASNLSDSYEVAAEGDKEKDQQRKDTFRGLLQESLVNYAQVILALDEMSVLMKDEWMIKPDLDKPLIFASGASLANTKVAIAPDVELIAISELSPFTGFSISDDGLTMYFDKKGGEIWTAHRKSVETRFANEKSTQLNGRQPTLSADELEIIFLSERSDRKKGESLWVAKRDAKDEPFRRPDEVTELLDKSGITTYKNACLSADGRVLTFNSYTGDNGSLQTTIRPTRKARWSRPISLPHTVDHHSNLTWPFVSVDGCLLLCFEAQDKQNRLTAWRRSNVEEPFAFHQAVTLPGTETISGRCPRYVAATNELLFLRFIEPTVFQLSCIKNFTSTLPVAAKVETAPMVVGTFDIIWDEAGKRGTSKYQFKMTNEVLKGDREIGTWQLRDEKVVITFLELERGKVAIVFDDNPNTFRGVHTWANGKVSMWTGKRSK